MTPNGPSALTTSNGHAMTAPPGGPATTMGVGVGVTGLGIGGVGVGVGTTGVGGGGGVVANEDVGIREVWSHNLEEEFKMICQVVQEYPFVAMDTEFPGVVARPIGEFKSTADYQYQLLRCNVDLLKIIQLGLTFQDEDGQLPKSDGPSAGVSTWQFNFKFNLTEDMYAEDSVDLLQNSGIQFERHEQDGIDPVQFAEMMLTSGLVLMEEVRWLSFHSGYDFGYLLNLLTNQNLPKTEGEFFEMLKLYFPNVYDVKYLMKSCKSLKGGLQEVANELEVLRIGPQHQAGSDSLLTGQTFFKMKEMFFEDDIDDSKYCGHLYGLGTNFVVPSTNTNSSNANSAPATAPAPAAASAVAASNSNENSSSKTSDSAAADSAATSAASSKDGSAEPSSGNSAAGAANSGEGAAVGEKKADADSKEDADKKGDGEGKNSGSDNGNADGQAEAEKMESDDKDAAPAGSGTS